MRGHYQEPTPTADLPSEILTKKLSHPDYQKLFELDSYSANREMEMTQNYKLHCGRTLLSEEQYCAESLWDIQPDPGDVVPNIIHYILLNISTDIRFYHTVCMLSSFWINQPKMMIIWHDIQPRGFHWDYLIKNLSSQASRVVLMPVLWPPKVYSHKLKFVQHYSDVLRLEILYLFGGMYFDMDSVIVKSFKPLFKYPHTAGREIPEAVSNAVLVCSRGNYILKRWHILYRFYPHATGWVQMSTFLQNILHAIFPKYIHIEDQSMSHPNYFEVNLLYGPERGWNWREKNYAVHLWLKMPKIKYQHSFANIKKEDSMIGDMFRWILYGTTSMNIN